MYISTKIFWLMLPFGALSFAQTISLVPGSTEPRIQLTGQNFQIYSQGTLFTSVLPGQSLSRAGVVGADLGYPVVYPDKILFLFGDTLGAYTADGSKYYLAPGSGGDDSIGHIPNGDLTQCHYIANVDQQLFRGNTQPNVSFTGCPQLDIYKNPTHGPTEHIFKTTTISGLTSGEGLGSFRTPSGAFEYNGRLYMSYVVQIQEPPTGPHFSLESIMAKADQSNASWSDTTPPTFTRLYSVSSHPVVADPTNPPPEANSYGKFMFNPVTVMDANTLSSAGVTPGLPTELQGASQVVFVFGSSWQYNRSNLYLAAFSAADVEAGTSKWFYYTGLNGSNSWSNDETTASPLLPDGVNIGNHSVVWNPYLKQFILMYGNVAARFSPTPWGPWGDQILTFGPQSDWARKLIHHPGSDPILRTLIPIYNPQNGQVVNYNDPTVSGVPYGPYVLDKSDKNADGSVTIYYSMSTWFPYEVFLVSSTFRIGVGGGTGVIQSAASGDASAVAPGSIASIFANGLSDRTAAGDPANLASFLGGVSVTVKDSAGAARPAQLYFVSPNQINFIVPPGTAAGSATVSVVQSSATIFTGATQVSPVKPGVFTANANGTGAAAGYLITLDSSNNSSTQPLFSCSAGAGTCSSMPLDLSKAQNGAVVELFGTGIKNGSTFAVTIDGVAAPVNYAGSQRQYPGLDQVNVQISPQLRGRGEVDVILTVDGQPGNTVRISVK